MALTKIILSGSTNGLPIKVAASSTPGTTIHDSSTDIDEVYLWAFNSAATAKLLTIEYGGTTDPDNLIEQVIPPSGAPLTLVLPGTIATGSIDIDAFCETANVVTIVGFAHRIA